MERKGLYQGGHITPLDDNVEEYGDYNDFTDFSDIIANSVFYGDMSFEGILECIEEQFNDYINLEDTENYVDIFYNQLHDSYNQIDENYSDDYNQDRRDVLDGMYGRFVDMMQTLFINRLMISIPDLESDSIHKDALELIFRELYEFFILDAKKNFKIVITKDINKRVTAVDVDNVEFYNKIDSILLEYTPLIVGINQDEFLAYSSNEYIIELFNDGTVVGNFLRKYSPKLYQNSEFRAEIINYIIMANQFITDIHQSVVDIEIDDNSEGI